MKNNQIFKQLAILIVSGVLILGCKKAPDQSSAESGAVSATTQNQVSLASDGFSGTMTRFTTVYNTIEAVDYFIPGS